MLTTVDDRPPVDLDEAECLTLLGTRGIGRLGFTDRALPAIVPLPYAVVDGSVVIPLRRGGSVAEAIRGSVVAFAVDSFDPTTRRGWGVTVVGPAVVVSAPERVAAFEAVHARTGAASDGHCYVVVQVGLLRGWRSAAPGVTAA